jgi:hypothetical protein
MHVATKLVIDIETGAVLEYEGYEYVGPVALCKGATDDQRQLAKDQDAFYQTLTQNFNDYFGNQKNILQNLTKVVTPIFAAGPNQYGYSTAEDTALRTQAKEKTGQDFAANAKALNNQLAARGGGDTFLPSGAEAQLQAQAYNEAAKEESEQNLSITQAGYEQGRQNWQNAASILSGTANMYNPTALAASADEAGRWANQSWIDVVQEDQAATNSIIGGILGGAAMAINPAGSLIQKATSKTPPAG